MYFLDSATQLCHVLNPLNKDVATKVAYIIPLRAVEKMQCQNLLSQVNLAYKGYLCKVIFIGSVEVLFSSIC